MIYFQVAIDGPVGSGKSTVARLVAERAGFLYIDTGAMYRAIALYAAQNNADLSDEGQIAALLDRINIQIGTAHDGQKIYLNNEDVTAFIRTNEISRGASAIAVHPSVRNMITKYCRNLANQRDVVMDGRDIGTHVLPDAQLKVYLDAPADIRAKRRFLELLEKGQGVDYEDVKRMLDARDQNDKSRKIDPLRAADDAVFVYTGDKNAEESADVILDLIHERRDIECCIVSEK